MRIFAIYLPQFHCIPENNLWWGDGFTEWTNVKKAEPLFRGHRPRHPLNGNYYNLLDKSTVEWQTSLMKQYGIDGFMYYHYWFCGKLLLEKPAENLLKWKDIDQPFFFCWANHKWIKSKNGRRKTLMPMEYGTEKDWEKHFQYLLPFFRDERYEKKDNRPLFMVFRPGFDQKKDIFNYFSSRCRDEGFDGLCLIENFNGDGIERFRENMAQCGRYIYYREPSVSQYLWNSRRQTPYEVFRRKCRSFLIKAGISRTPRMYDGEKLIQLKTDHDKADSDCIHGMCFEWDNTYRHGMRGYIITQFRKEQFLAYMDIIKEEDYFIINAWNEWCEGMVLEPTAEDGYKYLEWIREWRGTDK